VTTGAGEPNTGVGAAIGVVPQLVAGVKLLALFPPNGAFPKLVVGVTTVVGTVGCIGAGGVYVVPPLDGRAIPPLLAPFNFSCVLPHAARPNTAPMATWNNPAPCKVSGCHCTFIPP